jgi:hypothetical protein
MNTIKIVCLKENAEKIVKAATHSMSIARSWDYKIEETGTCRAFIFATNNEHMSQARLERVETFLNTIVWIYDYEVTK